jgi:hypothetical protein
VLYPTAAKLVAALGLAALAYMVSGQVMRAMPPETAFGIFLPFNIALGVAVGWLWLGPRSGEGIVTAVSYGATAAALLALLGVLSQGANEMMRLAMRNRYDGPFEAIGAIFVESIDLAGQGLTIESVVTLAVGGIVIGVVTDRIAQRYS